MKAKKGDDDTENYAMFTYNLFDDPMSLVCISDFQHQAHAASQSNGIIIDCSASSHFSSKHSKFLNYIQITPEPIQAADGHTFSALDKGDLKIKLPNRDQKPTPITLKNVYYASKMAFMLMSVGTIDHASYSVLIGNQKCITQSLKSNVIGQIPLVQ